MPEIKGRIISPGIARGQVLLCRDAISFLGGIDPASGNVMEKGHALEGQCIAGRVLVFPNGKGSTVGSYVLLQLAKNKLAPAAILNQEAEPIVAVGAIISNIPMLDKLEKDVFTILKDEMEVEVDGNKGVLRVS